MESAECKGKIQWGIEMGLSVWSEVGLGMLLQDMANEIIVPKGHPRV